MSDNWQWYGVKTVFRETPQGSPKGRDQRYVKGLTLVEERVVLIRARNFDEALRKGEKESKRYIESTEARNRYGQRLVSREIFCEAYDMSPEDPEAGVELFSAMEVVPGSVSDEKLLRRFIGYRDADKAELIDNFGDIVFAGAASGVRLTKDEKGFVAKCKELLGESKKEA